MEKDRKPAPALTWVEHLRQGQLADRWNVSPRTLERWRYLKKGPPFLKLGARVVYRLRDVEAYEVANAQQLLTMVSRDGGLQ